VAGTKDIITALQLDTKLDGIPAAVLGAALRQARGARLTILDVMREAIDAPGEMSPQAPRIITIKVPVDKIGEVIGPKGKMINSIQEDTGAEITIEDDGTIYIGATDGPSAEAARTTINAIANPHMPEVGERFLGTVVKTTTFGAFISLLPGKDGLLHITQLRKLHGGARIDNVDDVVKVGDKIQVEIREIDDRGKLSLVPVEVVEREAAAGNGDGGADDSSGADDRAPRAQRELDPVAGAGEPGIGFVADLHVDAISLGVELLQASELVFHVFPKTFGDLCAATFHNDVETLALINALGSVHTSSSRRRAWPRMVLPGSGHLRRSPQQAVRAGTLNAANPVRSR